ncbi:hypothetical protein GGR57DRAFT_516373 [Xylariaceae sp. FL1272]|nr:hypothetical protein GGR57DRAFT_516373 [Xylariaceae sp. FL1272]
MAALAEQRRRCGLAASVIHIGPVFGVGYIAQAIDETTKFAESTMRSGGYMPTSEYDFHQLFAEAVLAGRPGSHAPVEIVSGFRRADADSSSPPVWTSSPVMCYFNRAQNLLTQVAMSTANVSLKDQLATAQQPDEIAQVVQTAFYSKIQTTFQLDNTQHSDLPLESLSLTRMGIDSLSAVEIRGWFLGTMGVNIPVLKILNDATVGDLISFATNAIIAMKREAEERIKTSSPTVDGEPALNQKSISSHRNSHGAELTCNSSPVTFPLSYSQEMFWYVWASLHDKASLNHTGWTRIRSTIRLHDLETAAHMIGMHHKILRAQFIDHEGVPVQQVSETSRLELEHRQIEAENEVRDVAAMLETTVLDIEHGDSVRLLLLSISSTEHFLVFVIHPLVMDGFSFQIFLTQLTTLYSNPNLELSTKQYLDHAASQRQAFESGDLDQELLFWKGEFSSIPPPLPILKLSLLSARPLLTAYANERAVLRLTKDTRILVQQLCRRHSVTPFHFYIASFRALLGRLTDETDDVVVGVGDANRNQDNMMDVIGPFVNLLPVRLKTQKNMKFEKFLQYARLQVLSALENSKIPFQVLLSRLGIPRSATHMPLFQCFIDYRQGQKEFDRWGDVEMQFESFQNLKMGYDVALDIVEDPSGTSVHILEVRRDLYGQAGAETMIQCYERLINAYASSPTVLLEEPDLFDPMEFPNMMNLAQGPISPSQWPPTVAHRIEQIADQQPFAIAITNPDSTIVTYRDLVVESSNLARKLSSTGVRSRSHVTVLQEVTGHWISSILAIWRLGAVYIPLDLGLPVSRLAAMVRDSQPVVTLVDSITIRRCDTICGDGSLVVDVTKLDSDLTNPAGTIAAQEFDHCAILYTSGSTGTPKGVILKHIGLRNFSEMVPPLFDIGSETVLQQTSSVFDLSLIQITTALCHDGYLCLVPWNMRADAPYISNMAAVSQGIRLFNLYGPSETSLAATATRVLFRDINSQSAHGPVSAGSPLPNYSVYILDAQMKPVPRGVQGEIYIGGIGVGAGYLNKPALTAQKVTSDELTPRTSSDCDARLHRTGDLGRWSSSGEILVEGRVSGDSQIKLRGIRIDLREIEHAIICAANSALSQAVVSLHSAQSDHPEKDSLLVGYVIFCNTTGEDAMRAQILAIKSSIGEALPQYMCPAVIIPVESLPTLNSGKVDRAAIAALPLPATSVCPNWDSSDLTDTEKRLSSIWQDVVASEISAAKEYYFPPETDFFHVGGTSLRLLALQARIRSLFHVNLSILSMFEHSTLVGMARCIEGVAQDSSFSSLDWDAETSLTPDLNWSQQLISTKHLDTDMSGKVIVLTGATGAVGKALLSSLQGSSEVVKVFCIAVRNASNRPGLLESEKVTVFEGDLTHPRLGLSEEQARVVFSQADTVIHNGAEVSYLKTYKSLREPNVQSTKELLRLCLPRMVPFHFISSTAVEIDNTPGSNKVHQQRDGPLASIGSGYTISKQISESFLQNVKSTYPSWPMWVHRPSLITDNGTLESGPNSVIESIQRYSTTLNAIPVVPRDQMGLSGVGTFNVVPINLVVRGILDAVMRSETGPVPDTIQLLRHVGSEEIDMEKLCGWAPKVARDDTVEQNVTAMEEMDFTVWVSKAAKLGMNSTIVIFMRAVGLEMGLK